jgi:hypothetical protein
MKLNARPAVVGAVLGGGWALYAVGEIWRTDGIEILQWIMTAIVSLAIPVGAICGAALAALPRLYEELRAALAALFNCMIWCIEKVSNINEKVNSILNPKARRVIELVCLASLIGIVSTFILAYI